MSNYSDILLLATLLLFGEITCFLFPEFHLFFESCESAADVSRTSEIFFLPLAFNLSFTIYNFSASYDNRAMDVLNILERPLDQGDEAHQPPIGGKVFAGVSTQESQRRNRPSRWKQKRVQATGSTGNNGAAAVMTSSETGNQEAKKDQTNQIDRKVFRNTQSQMFGSDLSSEEQIHLDNLQRMASMEPTEIERQKQALIGSMDAGVLQALLRRAEIKEQEMNTSELGCGTQNVKIDGSANYAERETKKMQDSIATLKEEKDQTLEADGSEQNSVIAPESCNANSFENSKKSLHFLRPAGPPEDETMAHNEDLNGRDFLTLMHSKYFPELPVEHDKLAWMKPLSQEEAQEYTPEQDSLAPSEIRFDFNGDILGPQKSREVDTGEGLHHHGDAPMAAGYTIGELGRLARSVNVSQRCLAIRTLGRILYKLGKIRSSELRAGLQGCIDQNRILDSLYAANAESNSVTLRAYATEALWNHHQSNSRTAV